MTIEEKLEKYKDKHLSFVETYSDCIPIEEIEGEIIENASYSGYCVTTKNGTKYFTDAGIRGRCIGTFYIHNGVPEDIIGAPSYELEDYFCKLVINMPEIKNLNLSSYSIKAFIRKQWYDYQINRIKNKLI